MSNDLESIRAENERLRGLVSSSEAERVRSCNELMARATTAEAKLEEAAKVLEPFAKYAWTLRGRHDSQNELGWRGTNEAGEGDEVNITVGTFRAAKSFIANLKGAE